MFPHEILSANQKTIKLFTQLHIQNGPSSAGVGYSEMSQAKQFAAVMRAPEHISDSMLGRTLLDVGCGFGHLATFVVQRGVAPIKYTGFDIVPESIAEARRQHPDFGPEAFAVHDILTQTTERKWDYAFGVGVLNHIVGRNADMLTLLICKMLELTNIGIAVTFTTNQAPERFPGIFHYDLAYVLRAALNHCPSGNVLLDNTFLPHVACIYAYHHGRYYDAEARTGER